MNKEQALEKIKELENYIKELDSKPKRFKAEYQENYYINDGDASTQKMCSYYDFDDKIHYILGNMFRTRQEADANKQKYYKKLEILEWMEDNRKEFEYGEKNFHVVWNYIVDAPKTITFSQNQYSKYVFTEKKAQECIGKFGQDLKLIFE